MIFLALLWLLLSPTNAHQEHFKIRDQDDSTLKQVSIVFRHGDRFPDVQTAYPNSPYKNVTFYPHNFGDLNMAGQKRMYQVGRELRERYNDFLGDQYYVNLVESISSSYSRCQMSGQALHTGLFGTISDIPIKNLNWQSVLYAIIPRDQDNLISVHLTCPAIMFNVQYPESSNDPDVQIAFEALQNFSGYAEPINYRHAMYVYDFLRTSLENGLPVPEDFKPFYPEPLRKTAILDLQYTYKYGVNLIGGLIRRIAGSALAKATNTLRPADRKMFLYSGHDMNIYLLLQALNITWSHEWIDYGAAMYFELHNIEGIYGFKVYLQNKYLEPKLLDIPECGTFCPLSWLIELGNRLIWPNMCDEELLP